MQHMRFESQLSDEAVLRELGQRVGRLRLDRGTTQQQLADEAGVSRHTLLRLEDGQSVTLGALLRILRSLGLLEGLNELVPEPLPSPLAELERQTARRKRASGAEKNRTADDPPEAWRWGTP